MFTGTAWPLPRLAFNPAQHGVIFQIHLLLLKIRHIHFPKFLHLSFHFQNGRRSLMKYRAIENLILIIALQWHHNGRDSVSNHQPHDCLLNRLFRRRSKKTSNLRVTGLCAGNSPGTGEFPAQMASDAENVSIWWRHHANPMSDDFRITTIPWMIVSRCF